MKRFYLDNDYTKAANLTGCDYIAHAMRREVNERYHNGEEGFTATCVTVMDAMIPFAALTMADYTLVKIVQAMHWIEVKPADVMDALNTLNKNRYLRKRRLAGGRGGYELAYLS